MNTKPCKRVDARVECLQCHYPASESFYMQDETRLGLATCPMYGTYVSDPGHTYDSIWYGTYQLCYRIIYNLMALWRNW